MCGLTGFLASSPFSPQQAGPVLEGMTNAILHRGPDSGGHWLDGEAGIALGHRRLAIVDLTPTGVQPMASDSGRYQIVFNGEIYNHLDLRAELDQHGHGGRWRGTSDTETLLAGIEAWGLVPTLSRCVGMFAVALWDRTQAVLHLVRDRFGEKPLYYGWQGTGDTRCFLFGSELKALRAHPSFDAPIDRNALALMLRYNYVPAPHSIYAGICKVPPASVLTLSAAAPEPVIVPYWSAVAAASAGIGARKTALSGAEATDALEQMLSRTIRQQMIADVPLGAFLSGGIDSSTVVALMQAQSSRPVRTFSIGFDDAGYNEAVHAKAVAAHLGTDHTELYVTPQQALDVVPMLPTLYDEPFADSSQIPTYLVSRMARQAVTVALTGDAGDEVFAGYNRYIMTTRLWGSLRRLPVPLRRAAARALTTVPPHLLNQLGRVLPGIGAGVRLGDKIHKGAGVLSSGSVDDLYTGLVSLWQDPASVVLGATEPECWPDPDTVKADGMERLDAVERMMVRDAVTYLPDDILVKTDRAAMAVSLEGRVPFLDHRLYEFAWQLPASMKLNNGVGKWLVRQVLYRHVPQTLIDRPKMGFAVPLDQWLRGPLRDWAETLLAEERLRRDGLFDVAPIRSCWAEHLRGERNWSYRLWGVLMVQSWVDAQA